MMLNPKDAYHYFEQVPITSGTAEIGILYADYEVIHYTNVQNLTSTRSYVITCKQRFIVPNSANLTGKYDGVAEVTQPQVSTYTYPIMLLTGLSVAVLPSNSQIVLLDYSPKTINTAVNVSSSSSTSSGSSRSNSSEKSSGKSTSDTNSYEVSGSVGFFGDMPTGSYGRSSSQSRTNTSWSASATGSVSGADSQSMVSGSSSMSIKDWGAYASVGLINAPNWLWAQEYPWDVTQFHSITDQENSLDGSPNLNGTVTLPDFVQSRLVDRTTGYVLPPSHLSLYGVNFVESAKWRIQMPQTYDGADETVTFTHTLTCIKACHTAGDKQNVEEYDTTGQPVLDSSGNPIMLPVVPAVAKLSTMEEFTYTSSPIDVVKLGLDPIVDEGTGNGAVVGFVLSQFISLPPRSDATFRITSASNNILVTGSGFTAPVNNDSPMTADLSAGSVTFQVFFKDVDYTGDLSLYLKHWISSSASLCFVAVSVNKLPPIYRHVDAQENGSGSDNVMTLVLRNQDFSSADFYDYLVKGLNQLTITVSASHDPTGTSNPGIYSLRALAIG